MKTIYINAEVTTDERIDYRVITVSESDVSFEDHVFEGADAVSKFKWQLKSTSTAHVIFKDLPNIPLLLHEGFDVIISIDHKGRRYYDPRFVKGFRDDIPEIIKHYSRVKFYEGAN